MLEPEEPLKLLLTRLQRWVPLSTNDSAALLALPHALRTLEANEMLVRDGERATHSCVLISGYAFRQKMAGNGGRQILSLHMAGDPVDLHNSLLGVADHNVQALTRLRAVCIPVAAIQAICRAHPNIGLAMWYDTLVDGSMFREWTLNIGRRDAYARVAHLLCEFGYRLEACGLGSRADYELPMSQEQLADSCGLTPVHINRTLMKLEEDGLIVRTRRAVRIHDWDRLAVAADFDPAYLHQDAPTMADSSERLTFV